MASCRFHGELSGASFGFSPTSAASVLGPDVDVVSPGPFAPTEDFCLLVGPCVHSDEASCTTCSAALDPHSSRPPSSRPRSVHRLVVVLSCRRPCVGLWCDHRQALRATRAYPRATHHMRLPRRGSPGSPTSLTEHHHPSSPWVPAHTSTARGTLQRTATRATRTPTRTGQNPTRSRATGSPTRVTNCSPNGTRSLARSARSTFAGMARTRLTQIVRRPLPSSL